MGKFRRDPIAFGSIDRSPSWNPEGIQRVRVSPTHKTVSKKDLPTMKSEWSVPHSHAPPARVNRRSVGGGVAALSFDEEFQRRRINRRREAGGAGGVDRRTGGRGGAHGAARKMVHAVRDLGGGIYHGVTGVVMEPYRRTRVIDRSMSSMSSMSLSSMSLSSILIYVIDLSYLPIRSRSGRRSGRRVSFVE